MAKCISVASGFFPSPDNETDDMTKSSVFKGKGKY